jgi:peptide/nickel transport system substrate-binding protein
MDGVRAVAAAGRILMRVMPRAAVVVTVVALLLGACDSQKPSPSTAAPSAVAPSETAGEVTRKDTLILGYEGGAAPAPGIANPFVPAFFPEVAGGLHQIVQESLFYVNYESGKIEPWLAESFSFNADATELTLKIRHGVEWSDGQAFTAADVAFTFNLMKDHPELIESGAPGGIPGLVTSATATDPATVVVKFTSPQPRYVLDHLAVQIWGAFTVVPEHIWKDQDPATFLNWDLAKGWPVFTGPYRPTKATATEFDFDRNDSWWGAKTGFHALPAPKRIIFIDQGPEDRRVAQLSDSSVDGEPGIGLGNFRVAQANNPKLIAWLKDAPYAWIDPCPNMLEFNTQSAPWDDPQMRWAVSNAIDKQALANVTNEGTGLVAKWLFPDYGGLTGLLDGDKDVFTKYPSDQGGTPDLLKASAAAIEGKGYTKGADGIYVGTDGKPLQVRLLMKSPSAGGVGWGIATSQLVEDLNTAGIAVTPTLLATQAYDQAASVGDFDVRMYTICGSVVDPYATLERFTASHALPQGTPLPGNPNQPSGRWKNQAYTDLVNQIGSLVPGDPKIATLTHDALEIFQRELPAIPLYQQVRIVPYSTTYWTNWPTKENNYFHPPNWWMSFLRVVTELKPAQ